MLRSDEHHKILQMLERDVAAGPASQPPATLPPASMPPGPRILDLSDVPDLLALPAEPVSWLVDRMIPRAALTLVAGEPGSYKSWLALCLARAVAEGAPFLERACPKLPVLYLDRENPQAVVRERMEVLERGFQSLEAQAKRGICHPEPGRPLSANGGEGSAFLPLSSEAADSSGKPRPRNDTSEDAPQPPGSNLQSLTSSLRANLRIWGGWLADAPPLIGDARLLQIARRWKPLIIFDSLIRFHEGDENSATEMAPVMAELRALAHAGATVIALHHRAKSEASRYRGSSDILGGVDVAFSVSHDRDAGLLKLQCFKSRFAAEFKLTLRPEIETRGGFSLADPPGVSRELSEVETLRRLIATAPGLSQRELLQRAGYPRNRTMELLHREEGKHWRSERGPRNTISYRPLASTDQEEVESASLVF